MRAWLPCIYAVYRSKKAGGACAGGLFPSRKYSERISAIALQLQFSHKIYATWCCLKWWQRAAHIATLVWMSAVGSDQIIVVVIVIQPTVKWYLWHICCRIWYQFEIMSVWRWGLFFLSVHFKCWQAKIVENFFINHHFWNIRCYFRCGLSGRDIY